MRNSHTVDSRSPNDATSLKMEKSTVAIVPLVPYPTIYVEAEI